MEAVGFSGGLWIFWKENLEVNITTTHPQFVLMSINHCGKTKWSMAFVYGSPSATLRRRLWTDLTTSRNNINPAWMVMGDFNAVAKQEEVSNQETFNSRRNMEFNKWQFDEGLVDMGFTGPKFTWMRGITTDNFKGARLDRAMCTMDWLSLFPEYEVIHLPIYSSDHAPIQVKIHDEPERVRRKNFIFQVAWSAHKDFMALMERNWQQGNNLLDNKACIKEALERWNKEVMGNTGKRKRRILARLRGIQKCMTTHGSDGLFRLEKKLKKELEEILIQEELEWYQKSREDWICSGDRNTKFYHASATIRKNHSKIRGLRTSEGIWIEEPNHMKNMIKEYFTKLFAKDLATDVNAVPKGCFPKLSDKEWERVIEPIQEDEIKRALFYMAPWKAPGPDGLQAGFYQKTWQITGGKLIEHVKEFLNNGQISEGLNDTLVTLIPKVSHPEMVTQFRPISLCNAAYKLITKVLANKLKTVLPSLIGQEQSSFVPGRQIVENIIVYQEVLHSMRKKKGRTGIMMFKIDLEKAYDRLDWSFIRDTLKQAGLHEIWIDRIMTCVETSRLAVLWNGERMDW